MSNTYLNGVYRRLRTSPLVRRVRRLQTKALVDGPLTYNEDGLSSQHNCDFIHSKRFQQAYEAGKRTGSWLDAEVRWRVYIACWVAQRALAFEGDFVECGVNRGGTARAVMEYTGLADLPRRFFLLDTYRGIPDESISDAERELGRSAGRYSECYDAVRATFAPYSNVVIVRGIVPHTLAQVDATRVAYLHLDMNCAEPEISAARFFWPLMPSGAAILLDDYGWRGHIVQKQAFDEFAQEHGIEVLALPSGQGLMFKP